MPHFLELTPTSDLTSTNARTVQFSAVRNTPSGAVSILSSPHITSTLTFSSYSTSSPPPLVKCSLEDMSLMKASGTAGRLHSSDHLLRKTDPMGFIRNSLRPIGFIQVEHLAHEVRSPAFITQRPLPHFRVSRVYSQIRSRTRVFVSKYANKLYVG